MDNEETDEMITSPIERFEIPSYDEYDRDNMENLINDSEEGYVEVPIAGQGVDNSLWNSPSFNDVSPLINLPVIDDHGSHTSKFNTKELREGGMFMSKELLIHACRKYHIKHRREYRTINLDTKRMILECRGGKDKCEWELRASRKKKEGMWRIIKYEHDKHTCEVDIVRIDNVHFNKHFIAMDIKDLIQEDLRSPKQVMKLMLSKYGYKITYIKAWKTLQKAFVYLFGEWERSFEKLPAYMEMLQESNPGTIVYWDKSTLDSGNVSVNRVFWAFYPAIEGFKHCRPVISIDATHLIGKWKGVLMIAVTFDAENGILPIAYALVESENVDSWKWFMMCIQNGVTERQGLCIISDRHSGIMRVMKEDDWKPPNAYHRYCIRHFASNLNQKVKCIAHRHLLKDIAKENQQIKFCNHFTDFKELLKDKPDAVKWLEKVNPKYWSLAYDIGGRRWGSMTTNQSKSFNHVLMPCRDLPITALVHFTFKQANSYFIERRDLMVGHNKHFVPKIETLNNTNLVKAGHNEVQMYDRSKGIALVLIKSKSRAHEVSLEGKTCGCGKWQLFHYPCVHALAVCAQERLSIRDCVAYEFTTQAYVDTWAQTFNPQPDMTHWNAYVGPKHILNKQFKRVKRGRNPTKRRHNEMDQRRDPRPVELPSTSEQLPTKLKRIFKCSICGVAGHTKRSCTSVPIVIVMPRHTRDQSMHDMPSPSSSLGLEYTLLADVSHVLEPGPIDKTLLYKQDTHRSNRIWTTSDIDLLTVCHRGVNWEADERILAHLIRARFGPWYYMHNYEVDWSFMTTLVERWRLETHTFHLRNGEMTITLEDVGVLTGLPIEGRAVTVDHEVDDYAHLCE
ncbi:hypothetical protein QQ045_015095 [Rhodiola kirilowii]